MFETPAEEYRHCPAQCSIFTLRCWCQGRRNEEVNLLRRLRIQLSEQHVSIIEMTTWQKRDWHQFYERARRPWRHHRPPRPIYPSGLNRVLPAAGFSLSELDDAHIDLELAERLGLPVDAGRMGAYGPNVTALRDFARTERQPL